MAVTDTEIDRIARDMIARHGPRAARLAAEHLNEMIDRGNIGARDLWACVVHAIHRCQDTAPGWMERAMSSSGSQSFKSGGSRNG